MRVREFMMKDAYNFCANEKQFMKSYQKFYDAYLKIAEKLDLKVIPVLADSGAIGGTLSHEFQVESPQGDQIFYVCEKCRYAANIEKCEFKRVAVNLKEKIRPFKIIKQPEWVCTMEDNLKHYGEPLWRYLKNVVYKDEKGRIIIASLRGDQTVNEIKLKRALGVESLTQAKEKDLKRIDTKPGYVHSWAVKGVTFIGDLGLPMVKNYIGGQKEKETDSINVNYGRDFKYKILADIVEAKNGDPCAKCKNGKLQMKKGFEWGHCFKIDHFYTKPQEGCYTDKSGKRKLLWMGSYGIGVGRSMACIVETHHDKKGIIWPKSVAPYEVHLIDISDGKRVNAEARKIYEALKKEGIEVLWDDRENVSAGVKFADSDLIGIPVRLLISEKTGEKIEWKGREEKKGKLLTLTQVLKRLS